MTANQFIVDLFWMAFFEDLAEALKNSGGDETDWKVLSGKRLTTSFKKLKEPTCYVAVMIAFFALAPIRLIAKFLQRNTRIARINRAKAGSRSRPPAYDATCPARSPFIMAAQFYSALLASSTGCMPMVHGLLQGIAASARNRGLREAWLYLVLNFRQSIVKAAAAVYWRHIRRSKGWFWLFVVIIDPNTPEPIKKYYMELFRTLPDCCLGFALAMLRKRLTHIHLKTKLVYDEHGCFLAWVHGAISSAMQAIDLSTGYVEELHAGQQRLLVHRSGGQSHMSFFAKCVNRLGSQSTELGRKRNGADMGIGSGDCDDSGLLSNDSPTDTTLNEKSSNKVVKQSRHKQVVQQSRPTTKRPTKSSKQLSK